MNSIDATIRDTSTKGQVNTLRGKGLVPAIIYGGSENNQKISVSQKLIKSLSEKENFLSNTLTLNIGGKSQKVLPREIKYDVVSDEPIHLDFLRVIPGATIILSIPVKFINHEKSPGLKRGGVLNIVRRKVELKCPGENIPDDITVDLSGTDIGTSIKISSVKLSENVLPTIDRDFVIATVAAPTVMKEPEKPTEETVAEGAEGEVPSEGAEASPKDGDPTKKDDKSKDATEKKSETKKPSEKK